MGPCSGFQHEATVAIGAFDEVFVAHFEIDPGMTECSADALAFDAGIVDFDDFGGFDGHGGWLFGGGGIIATAMAAATLCYKAFMVTLNRIYTKTGDKGETGLGDGTRLPKHALRIQAFGTIDEANAAIGIARLHLAGAMDAMMARIQNDLFDLGADLCVPESAKRSENRLRIADSQVERLEREIDAMNAELAPLTSFVLPGGTPGAAYLHLARTIVRRAERLMVELSGNEELNPAAIRYANRLSDHLFVASRFVNDKGAADVLWVPGATR
jgi:cob(I)alamin adenosyltransferase